MTYIIEKMGQLSKWSDGSKFWHWHGQFHREDGPACEYPNGTKDWYWHGKRHREDGPASNMLMVPNLVLAWTMSSTRWPSYRIC
jgi:hypothetical protein